MSSQAFICDAIRTPFGRYGGALSSVRTDDLGAVPLRALMARNPNVDWQAITDVIFGCANQAGEDNRNVAHMSSLLAGLPFEVSGATINRLCGSGLDAVGTAARAIRAGEAGLMIAGGVESMSRAPFVMPKAESAFSRNNAVYDTTIGWRFVNKLMKEKYGVDSMPETAENVATDFKIEREAQDRMALASQLNAVAAQKAGHLAREITAVTIPQKKGDALVVDTDEHPRATTLETLAKLKGVVRPDGTVLDEPGYDLSTRLLYLPTSAMNGVKVADMPSAAEIAAARETVLYPIRQFPFVSTSHRSNWLGMALTPLIRTIVPPPYQLGIIEASNPGSGKSYLLSILRIVHGAAVRSALPNTNEEWSKVVPALLSATTAPISDSPPAIFSPPMK